MTEGRTRCLALGTVRVSREGYFSILVLHCLEMGEEQCLEMVGRMACYVFSVSLTEA
jgi:hypothetical protein